MAKSALKMCCTKKKIQTKVVTNQKPQLLCYVTFFVILHHFGVIAASQICSVSVSRQYCADIRNRVFFVVIVITTAVPSIFFVNTR